SGHCIGRCTCPPGVACPAGQVCSIPVCVTSCPSGLTACNAVCMNLQSDANNCGACGHVCPTSAPFCCSGSCVNALADPANCGGCGHVCPAGQSCSAGRCICPTGQT